MGIVGTIYDPRNMDFMRWASLLTEELSTYNVPSPVDEESWASWAVSLFNSPNLVSLGLPDPRGFANWQDWAEITTQTLES